jgi:hypothetical protein
MKLCSKCRKTPWPYALVLFIASCISFVTWLTLSAAGLRPEDNFWWTSGIFLFAALVLVSYMVSCMRRHCSDDQHLA